MRFELLLSPDLLAIWIKRNRMRTANKRKEMKWIVISVQWHRIHRRCISIQKEEEWPFPFHVIELPATILQWSPLKVRKHWWKHRFLQSFGDILFDSCSAALYFHFGSTFRCIVSHRTSFCSLCPAYSHSAHETHLPLRLCSVCGARKKTWVIFWLSGVSFANLISKVAAEEATVAGLAKFVLQARATKKRGKNTISVALLAAAQLFTKKVSDKMQTMIKTRLSFEWIKWIH